MAYFAPGTDMVAALAAAARRGVDVALVLPGRSDFALVLHAGRSYYDELLSAGVRIHEMDQAVMHAKTAVIDGVLSGTARLDGSLERRLAMDLDVRHRGSTGTSEVEGDVALTFGRGLEAFDVDVRSRMLSLATVGLFAPQAGLRGSRR